LFAYDEEGYIKSFPPNVKIIATPNIALAIDKEDTTLIKRIMELGIKLAGPDMISKENAVIVDLRSIKHEKTQIISSYIIQFIYPETMIINNNDLNQIRSYSIYRIIDITIGMDLVERKPSLTIHVLSCKEHVSTPQSTLLIATYHRSIHFDDNSSDSTQFLKRQRQK